MNTPRPTTPPPMEASKKPPCIKTAYHAAKSKKRTLREVNLTQFDLQKCTPPNIY